ncbi:hypothetical protein ACFDR9_003289 [Janthinobacterium sp. CG_23.3]|uniref:DEAD/DEAH box helicase n=1 Tax=Janthinobacterium sp. CG_23.3 TaxID=3349634 RepID=UPI0038D3B277
MTPFTEQDIRHYFDAGTFGRGEDYARRGKVRAFKLKPDIVDGEVSGSGGQRYTQQVRWRAARTGTTFHGDCTCPMQGNCKHVVAVLLSAAAKGGAQPAAAPPGPALPYALSAWLRQLGEVAQAPPPLAKTAKIIYRLEFVLMWDERRERVNLHMCKARLRADGAVVSVAAVADSYAMQTRPPDYLTPAELYQSRVFFGIKGSGSLFGPAALEPAQALGAELLRMLLAAGKLSWAAGKDELKAGRLHPLSAGAPRAGALGWHAQDDGGDALRLDWQFDDGALIDFVLPTEPPLYLHAYALGELALAGGARAMPMRDLHDLVARAPLLAGCDRLEVSRQLAERGLAALVSAPPALRRTRREDIAPRPFLLLGGVEDGRRRWHGFAVLAFDYDGLRASFDPAHELQRHGGAGTELIVRDAVAEAAAAATLAQLGFAPVADADSPLRTLAGAMELPSEAHWLAFAAGGAARLRAAGWLVEMQADYRYDLAQVDDWYADVADGGEAGNAWFELELGVLVDGARVPLLPVLVQLIREAPHHFDAAALAARADDEALLARLPGGVRVALPWGRLKPILAALGELYFKDGVGDGIRLPVLDAARLAELEAGAQLRWLGGERLRAIGRKLAGFGGVQAVAAPAGLRASLRGYQSEGLAWMQFLREYGLAGILADDMGLGKTVQTLAHILLEKEAGRLTAPALVVAPTSLMGNWQAEAARFAPDLRVLLLQGPQRLERFGDIGRFDLVLTSYALLARDEEPLRAQRYHLLILDESQYIKNSRSKAAQTAALLTAAHRLCLTGTPLQNHLGELWSQFHFLLPGLLGDEKGFNADFRKPIEKLGDGARNALLIRRIKPFLLRRTKDRVATELPAKTEMVREVELAGAQRDLYETVRVAMDKKVRDEIARKGVARSQIVILEALLKLRQVCCDPRLVKIAGAKSGAPSAKLAELMEMIATLLDEGRTILVFSQFTSMLALIEDELRQRAIAYALLTGATGDRAAQVELFQSGAVPIFLISLKAGGVGLNLTAADTVIHYDPWWNPAAENQATDRAWRIGQDKPVFVYKLIAKGTLEEKIQLMQRKKADLADAVLAEGDGAAEGLRITQDDLQAIFAPL